MPDETSSKGERTHQAILEAAYQLFLEQGYAATSMRQIAEKAHLALGGIYNHFAGKEAIFSELIFERHPFHQIMPIMVKTSTEDIEVFVRQTAHTMVRELGRRPDFVKLMFIEIVEFNGRNMPRLIDQILPQVLPVLARFGKSKKVLRSMSPFIFFRAFLGLFFSYYMSELLLANTPVILGQGDALDHFVDIFLHGVLADKEPA